MKQLHIDMVNKAVAKALEVSGRNILLEGWVFKYSKALKCFGMCHYNTKTITLSEPLADSSSYAAVMDTITHEIAHVLAGHAAGHGPTWVEIHKSMGGPGTRTTLFCKEQEDLIASKYKWHVINTLDGTVAYRYLRKPRTNWSTAYIRGKPETLGKLVLRAV